MRPFFGRDGRLCVLGEVRSENGQSDGVSEHDESDRVETDSHRDDHATLS